MVLTQLDNVHEGTHKVSTANYTQIPTEELADAIDLCTPGQVDVLCAIPFVGIASRAKLATESHRSVTSIDSWLSHDKHFHDVYHSLATLRGVDKGLYAVDRAQWASVGAVQRDIELAHTSNKDDEGRLRAPSMLNVLSSARERIYKLAGLASNATGNVINVSQMLVQVIQEHGSSTGLGGLGRPSLPTPQ